MIKITLNSKPPCLRGAGAAAALLSQHTLRSCPISPPHNLDPMSWRTEARSVSDLDTPTLLLRAGHSRSGMHSSDLRHAETDR